VGGKKSKPAKPAKPTSKSGASKSGKPAAKPSAAKSNQKVSAKPVKPAKSAKLSKPVKSGKSAKPAKPAAASKPAKSAKPVKPAKPAVASKPVKTAKPITPARPMKAQAHVTSTKPTVPAKPAISTKPSSSTPVNAAKATPKSKVSVTKVAPVPEKEKPLLKGFLKSQHQRLLDLRDALLDQMSGVARDNLRSRSEGNEASAFGMHQADAGSDSYDRDFALNLLSQEQDSLYEIEEAIKRAENGTYGVCEMSGARIPQARLEALPFARYTVECQEQLEQQQSSGNYRTPVTSLFGLSDADTAAAEAEDEA
jgi:DnaK suppressor protein